MIDLHLHLDGSLSEQDFLYLAKKDGVDLGDDFPNNIYVPMDCPSLDVYLERFALPLKLLQSEENIAHVTQSLVRRLYNMGYIYAEIRFAPQLHLEKGLSQLEVAKAALRGLEEGLNRCPGFEANLILCTMRHGAEKVNMETIEVANELKGTRIVAVDLAGSETMHPSSYYNTIFDLAIGHGVHPSLDPNTVIRVKEENVCFEFCPTSNLQTKSLKTYSDVPLKGFNENHIPFTVNSDNMTVSNTDVYQEFSHLHQTFGLTKDDVYRLLNNSIEYSFTSDEVKERLRKTLDERIGRFYHQISK